MDNRKTGRNRILFSFLIMALAVGIVLPSVSAAGATEDGAELKNVRVGYLIYDGFQEGEGDEPKSGYGYEYLQQVA
ncbi:MAG: hypothetical protein ACI4EO_07480, partial [Blautia sp.]